MNFAVFQLPFQEHILDFNNSAALSNEIPPDGELLSWVDIFRFACYFSNGIKISLTKMKKKSMSAFLNLELKIMFLF